MDMTSQYGFFTNEVYPSNHNIYPVTRGFSEKAKAFTIDALLSKDKGKMEPVIRRKLPFHTKIVDCEQTFLKGRPCGYENNISTPGKKQNNVFSSSHAIALHEKFAHGSMRENMKGASKQNSYIPSRDIVDSPQHLNFNSPTTLEGPFYSPLMTGGFFRPVECYSPMSYEGQSTPAGLKTFYQSPFPTETMQQGMNDCSNDTPDLKKTHWSLSNGYSTPKDKHGIPVTGGSKMLSSRRHERLHPYLSSTHKMTPDKSDTDKVYIQESPKTELKGREKGKRHRTAFTPEQLQCLEAEFEKQQYLVGEERFQLAESLNLKVSHVKVWFQNRRIKWRKEQFGQRGNYNSYAQLS